MSSKLHIATPFESICIICFSFLFAPQFYQKRFLILLNDKIVVDINGRSSRYYCAEWHKESMGKTVFNCGRCYSLVSVCVHWVHFLCTTTTKIWMRLHLYFIFLCLFAFLFLWLWRNSENVETRTFLHSSLLLLWHQYRMAGQSWACWEHQHLQSLRMHFVIVGFSFDSGPNIELCVVWIELCIESYIAMR